MAVSPQSLSGACCRLRQKATARPLNCVGDGIVTRKVGNCLAALPHLCVSLEQAISRSFFELPFDGGLRSALGKNNSMLLRRTISLASHLQRFLKGEVRNKKGCGSLLSRGQRTLMIILRMLVIRMTKTFSSFTGLLPAPVSVRQLFSFCQLVLTTSLVSSFQLRSELPMIAQSP